MEHYLIDDAASYKGAFVAIAGSQSKTVIGSGETADEALEFAAKGGFPDPVLIYVPRDDEADFLF